ncbi:MAG TPA: NUDIX domain-containing protein [Rhizomicrobium sp.]|nr:NUDIX domain-containing protein [Rhizomicrobium sp.]
MNLLARLGGLALPAVLWLKTLRVPVALGVAAIAEDKEGHVVLVRHSYRPGWHLPGGGVARGEAPAAAIMRELGEEVGLRTSDPPALLGVFTRRVGISTNVIVLYRVSKVEFAFRPNFEILEILRADPVNPPPGTAPGTRRRLAEHAGQVEQSAQW